MASASDPPLFTNATVFLQNAIDEAQALKAMVQHNNELRHAELDDLMREIEQERFERRDTVTRIRYEFEEFVQRKIDKIFAEVELMKHSEDKDELAHQQDIDDLTKKMRNFKNGLTGVLASWKQLCAQTLNAE
mmetsp:Transcript_41788/g.115160  ORF Transcript_41788/g.115160 Transcript_41788/m.115160 type:complete len:133 (-) Transcript_41788:180-578(-)|eukprot:CAMPEP_0117538228 /NCGR_PEP_ID=MMETSP0784-20121206/42372_1 /TAXON_ID=39447 /ORGANISM="" /LENGTH=132 /DNA_ID=CAMNT_0005334839 /DNA_START=42 /DNA_END=440 /DNA_ORIENTATION=+